MEAVVAVLLGLPMTLLVTAAAFAIGLVGGIPLMLGLRSRHRVVRLVVRFVVDLIRGIPPIVWLFVLFFGVSIGALRFNALAAAIVGLGVISAAYLAEIYRGGFATLPAGQTEAARALGLGRRATFVRVLAPQAARTALPSITTFLLALVKDSSIASTIGVTDMVFAANTFVRQNPMTAGLTPFFVAAAVYVAISIPLAIVARRLDSRLRRSA
ncbi:MULTISPECIES: amino acid ABC transporter permease [Microbacterium]|uniref:amino acid ABC transporter permease n=1 Tax=Microbacterium TaxID=33882 RepID=UPI00277E771E|nr:MULTISPECIES: amino acid ABC transporter permease [Microbacterium]MDQ1076099.1 polar amino acid transport system permease protein [Microbacterium sp. SORGH_AS_0969]MDQ1116338.1 polar amino acid transport system permease protein [Microbacterium testaceum]